ncbi:hypothetical protein DID80_03020 [Candidatus Marinamargulisbacteria bacterium SCGC AAA071-K20]|nr:hypothetical protein DID80_03020 [Candidatus Marinamargulisbacteria bacterium SCGC AAA071-K20]
MKYIFLLFISILFCTSSIKAEQYKEYFDQLPDNGIRELATAAEAWERHYFKSVEYTINSQTPGYVRKDYSNVRRYNKGTKQHEVEVVVRRNWIDGQPVETNKPLDFALASIQDGGHFAFFVVELPQGVVAYTKDGRFRVDFSGRLVTLSGNFPVLGEDGHIFIPVGADITSSAAGQLYNGAQVLDRLKIVVFDSSLDMRKLEAINGAYFVLKEEVTFQEGVEGFKVMQGWVTQSNSFFAHDQWVISNSYTYVYNSLYKLINVDKQIYTTMSPEQ